MSITGTNTNYYEYFFNELADKRTSKWLLMTDPFAIITIATLYLFWIKKWGPEYMESRKPYNITKIIQCYNIFQIISCVIMIYGLGTGGWFTGELSLGCEPINDSNTGNPLRLATYAWWFFTLKIVELIETVFFILRKKYNQVSNLHVYHHIATLMMMWCGAKYYPGGMGTFSMLINSIVHLIMYGYYFLSTLGPEWQNKLAKWKNKITIIQMIQFTIVIIHTFQIFHKDCDFPNGAAYLFLPNVAIVFYMFYNFYRQTYNKKVKSK